MKPTTISRSFATKKRRNHESNFYRYLKPGALAQLRDSKINSLTRLSVHRFDSIPATPQQISSILDLEQVPCFLMSKIRGPACSLKRKRLVAARSVFLLNLDPSSSPVLDPSSSSSNDNVQICSVMLLRNVDGGYQRNPGKSSARNVLGGWKDFLFLGRMETGTAACPGPWKGGQKQTS
ncbi:hypothetical protein SADUNF_Sadunf06G0036800 [Salix dunnii]|uniref:Uncharacterized protein n=1 Tax=Salix dunnii TaxID=1413687 RepID=A0A835K5C3_9ROSI|nr:hypothetical protein SADUNF_Sadunf06G0036800 [Salix dunnii]